MAIDRRFMQNGFGARRGDVREMKRAVLHGIKQLGMRWCRTIGAFFICVKLRNEGIVMAVANSSQSSIKCVAERRHEPTF